MATRNDAFPLAWPAGWPRTKYPERSRFGATFATARDELIYELELLGAADIVISTNVELRRDGLPYANRPEPTDTGVYVPRHPEFGVRALARRFRVHSDTVSSAVRGETWKVVGE